MANDKTCSAPDCLEPVFRRGLCQGHMKRLQRNQPIDPPLGALAWEELHEAILNYAHSDSDEDHAHNKATLLRLLRRWARAGCPTSSTSRGRIPA